jgi:hypothetical protein
MDERRCPRTRESTNVDTLPLRPEVLVNTKSDVINYTPDFSAELSLAGQSLGMFRKVDLQLGLLKVGALETTGAVAAWNSDNPEKKIDVGDVIVMVNGETDVDEMLRTKTKNKKFVMAIKKAHQKP